MADDKKIEFTKFLIKIDDDRKEKKAAIPFLSMLQALGIDVEDDDISDDKIVELKAKLDAILAMQNFAGEDRKKGYEEKCSESECNPVDNFMKLFEAPGRVPEDAELAKSYFDDLVKCWNNSNGSLDQYNSEKKALDNDDKYRAFVNEHGEYLKKLGDVLDSFFGDNTQKELGAILGVLADKKTADGFISEEMLYAELWPVYEMPDEVWKDLFALRRQDKDAFEQAYNDYFATDYPRFASEYVKDSDKTDAIGKDGNKVIKNKHHYFYDKNSKTLRHTIFNLEGTGLNVSWIGKHFGLACDAKSLTPAQLQALHDYCMAKGISITDFLDLGKLSVKEGGKDLGTVKDYWEKNFGDGQREGPANENEDTGPSVEGVSEAKAAYDTLSKGLNGGVSRLSFDEVLTEPDLDVTRNKLVSSAEFRSGLMGNYNPRLTKFRFGWNSTIISVYASENDKLVDGERDKNGRRTQTKKFAIELRHTVPPIARIYMGTDKDFTADHARLALDGMKKSGCLYFMLPPPDKIGGKKAMGAWMKACVKTGMIPICKTAETPNGVVLGAADLHAIKEAFDEEVKTGQLGTKDKIVFMMRLSQQLERQEEYRRSQDPNYRTHSSVQTKMEYFKQAPYFEMFQSSHLQKLEEYITEGMEKYGWDDIDKTAAIYALGHVIKDLAEGKVNGKPVDPLKVSEEDFKNALVFYQTMEKPRAVKTIFDSVKKFDSETVRENVVESSFNRAVNQEIKNAEAYVKQVCSTVQKNTTIEIKPEIDGRRRAVDRSEYQQSEEKKWDTTHSAEYKDLVKDVKAYGKEQKNRSSSGKSTESFEEWKKRMSGHSAGGYDGRAR